MTTEQQHSDTDDRTLLIGKPFLQLITFVPVFTHKVTSNKQKARLQIDREYNKVEEKKIKYEKISREKKTQHTDVRVRTPNTHQWAIFFIVVAKEFIRPNSSIC